MHIFLSETLNGYLLCIAVISRRVLLGYIGLRTYHNAAHINELCGKEGASENVLNTCLCSLAALFLTVSAHSFCCLTAFQLPWLNAASV